METSDTRAAAATHHILSSRPPVARRAAPAAAAAARRWSTARACAGAMAVLAALGASGALAGCNDNPAPGSAAYKEGELGNGDFLFACDDGVACLPYRGDARKFPKQIATGSNFDVRFVAKGQQGTTINIDGKRYEGVTVEAVAPYVSKAPGEFAAIKPGYGTVMARDSAGTIIDYVTLKIVPPDDLIVYDANFDAERGDDPPRIQSITLKIDEAPRYRVVAEYGGNAAAGSIPVKWEAKSDSGENVVVVESYASGVVNLRAKSVGKATLTATGASLTKTIEVEVTQ